MLSDMFARMPPTRRQYLARAAGVGSGVTAGVSAGCLGDTSPAGPRFTLRIGSKGFDEQRILGYLAYHSLRDLERVRLVDRIGRGDTQTNWAAVRDGTIDLYWEYTGTVWGRLPPVRDERIMDPRAVYERAAADARDQGVAMAPPADFSNEYVLVTDAAWSRDTGVETIGDLLAYASAAERAVPVAVNGAFYHRRDGWPGLFDHYDADPAARASLSGDALTVTSIGLTYELLASGDATVANGFASDPQLDRDGIVTLDDDGGYFLPYNPAPTAHAPTVDAHPAVFTALEPVVDALSEPAMRRLNRRVFVDGELPSAVAESFLSAEVR